MLFRCPSARCGGLTCPFLPSLAGVFLFLLLLVSAGFPPAAGAEGAAQEQTQPAETVSEEAGDGRLTQEEADARAAEVLRKQIENAQREAENAANIEKKVKEAEELSQNTLIDDIWISQRSRLSAVIEESTRLSENFLTDTGVLDQLQPVEQDIRRLLVMVSEFRQWPSPLEAVHRRLGVSGELAESLVSSAAAPQVNASNLLDQLNTSAENLDALAAGSHEDTAEYLEKINTARFMLTAVISRYASVLAPAQALVDRVREVRQEIAQQLPELWLDYYTSGPVPWLSGSEWLSVPQKLGFFSMGLSMRQFVEVPITTSQWQSAVMRFLVSLVVFAALGFIVINKLLPGSTETHRHLRRCSLPWNVVGLSLLAASVPPSLEPFRLLLALGNLCLIMGQITLAWDLRRVKHKDVPQTRSPLVRLIPLTLIAYLLLYAPLPGLVTLMAWLVCLVASLLLVRRRGKHPSLGDMQLEPVLLELLAPVIWICLIFCLVGCHFYSMAIYLLYSSLAIAVQLSVGALSVVSRLNEGLSSEDGRSMALSFLLALAAPFVVVLSFGALGLWIGTLPGGLDLLQFYIFKSVSIGDTEFNFMQVLLIATAFFLARTASRMGKSLIVRLVEQSSRIDRSLITPLQTIYFYFVWFVFILFSLRSLGLNLSSLAVIAGGLSVGIGFGMQTIVNNFVSGIILIFSRTLQVGDIVEVGSVVGRIKQITVRATVVETYDSAIIYVPNSAFVSGNLTNWTSNSRSCRQHVLVSVAYGSDTEKVVKILLDTAEKSTNTLAFPRPAVQLLSFGDSNLDFRLTFWVADYDVGAGVCSELRLAINKRFEEEGIEIAYPTMDVNMRGAKAQPKAEAPRAESRRPAPFLSRHPVVLRRKRRSIRRGLKVRNGA